LIKPRKSRATEGSIILASRVIVPRDLGQIEFIRRYKCPVRSLVAFEKSEYADDWYELMCLYLVRRTRRSAARCLHGASRFTH
jgi:hypothetical protein